MPAPQPMLHIRLLGEPQISGHGSPLGLRMPPRALSLLVYLLVHRDRPLARDAVAFLFWPDLPESEARAKLRYDFRELRDALPRSTGEPWVLADNRTIRWNPAASCWLDVAEFERLAADPTTVAAAVELYRGDLADRVDDEWLQRKREQLRELQSSLLFGLLQSTRAGGDPQRAAEYAQQLLRHDPWREDAIRAILELRCEMGDRAGALQFYEEFAHRLRTELGVDPMPETIRAHERALATLLARSPRHNIPPALTTFVGREREVDALSGLLDERRIVTLIGTGGVGKTRLALETGRALVDRFADGVWLVELASLTQPELIVSTVASSLGLQSPSEASLLAMLAPKHMLLVLDNCEHLIADAARLVERLVLDCPQIHILATSREPLRVTGERTQRVVSLELPSGEHAFPSLDTLRASPAVRLFLDRVADVSPAFRIDAESEADRTALATISHRLDGIPLAIELAAARASSLNITSLAQRLNDRFTLLTAGRRTALPRQQTLRATLDWSYGLLTTAEQQLLHRMAIFAGGWTLDAVQAICTGDDAVDDAEVVDVIASLVDKSLVVVEPGPVARYRLLETTRAYALERLVKAERQRIARRHAEYFLAFAQRNDNTWGATGSSQGIERFVQDLDNFRAALRWSLDSAQNPRLGGALIASLRWSFAARSLNAELVRWCELALAALGRQSNPVHEGAVQLALAASMGTVPFFPRFHYYRAGRAGRFLPAAERAAEIFAVVGDETNRALALSLAGMHLRLADEPRAESVANEALAVAGNSDKRLAIAMALYAKSFAIDQQDTTQRAALLTEALDWSNHVANTYAPGAILHALAEVAFESGDAARARAYAREIPALMAGLTPVNLAQAQIIRSAYCLVLGMIDEARETAREALTVARAIGEPMIAAAAFQHIAGIAAVHGAVDVAAQLLGVSDARRAGAPSRLYTEQTGYDRALAIVRERHSDESVARLMRDGQGWSIDRAIALAMTI